MAYRPVRICIRTAIAKRVVRNAFNHLFEVTLFLVEKGFAVRNEVLKIAELRAVYRGIVDLRDDALPERVPEVTGGGIGGAHAGLVAVRPAGLNTGFPERLRSLTNSAW